MRDFEEPDDPQEDLFIHGLSRNIDPDTSHAAGKSTDATKLMQLIYDEMCKYGWSGCISDDLRYSKIRKFHQSITPRFRQMIDRGMIELTGEKRKGLSGRQQQVRRVLSPPFIKVERKAKECVYARILGPVQAHSTGCKNSIYYFSKMLYCPFCGNPIKVWEP